MANKTLTSAEAKAEIIRLVGAGRSVAEASKIVGKSRATYDYYRRTDAEFVESIDRQKILVSRGKGETPQVEVPDFPEFCEKYLGQKLWPHQLQWFDLLEGREPRNLHPSMVYEPGESDLLIVNTPPGHAKSTTLTSNYAVWRIIKDPDVKILIASKTQKLATQFLLQIKNRLTHPAYADLQRDFAPPGGFDGDSASWKQDLIYVSSNVRSGEAKDPTVQAIGIGGQLYGSRADFIILDDAITNSNAHQYDDQVHWVQTEVMSRLPDGGKLLVIGTRMAPKDMYGELRNADRYHGDDVSPWTYFSQPAVLNYDEDVEKWETLWPYADAPSGKHVEPNEDGLYPKWTGPILAKRRARMTPSEWARVYQQEQVAEDTIFKPEDIRACQQMRSPGFIPDDEHIGRKGGMEGLRLIAGLDPAAVGYTAAVLLGVEIRTGKRYVIDVYNKASITPTEMRDLIKSWTIKYGVDEWRIEQNAFQKFLTLDPEINAFLANRGSILTPHTTGNNKHDSNFGVMAMTGLFQQRLIVLPNSNTEAVKAMIEQLCVWQPDSPRGTKTDVVMALWFAELRAQELIVTVERTNYYRDTPFTTRGDKAQRYIERNDNYQPAGRTFSPMRWG
jgi:Terminase RNaseH-like domain